MEFLGPFHPQIVHTPIAMLLFSPLFMLVGRLTDSAWWRKAAVAMLVIGVVGAFAALQSGEPAGEHAERAGVPESAIEAHEAAAKAALLLGAGALVLLAVAGRVKPAKGALETVALLLQLGAAVAVGVAGHRGGILVYEHGANVRATAAAGGTQSTADESRRDGEDHEERDERDRH